ncbi:hypothetical protein [Geobacillus thermoleovorans]|uniref:hypothetical protein n=1 Tax=Geobacillus thermoleovorans TaxID=33941 RepID=UPI003F58B178
MEKRVALITRAARGIGYEVAKTLAASTEEIAHYVLFWQGNRPKVSLGRRS